MADRFGFVLIFDEVKTRFRHAIGGHSSISGVKPDLLTFGKAVANGYPVAVLAGRRELMDYFVHPDPAKRALLAGTYNAHPVPMIAAIVTVERLFENNGEVYHHVESLGARMQAGLEGIVRRLGLTATVSRQGSGFCLYFMDHAPVDWHDLASHHSFELDEQMRQTLIQEGIYYFPLATKQCSISAAHTAADIDATLQAVERVLSTIRPAAAHLASVT